MKNLIPAVTAVFLTAASAHAADVKVVETAEPNMVAFEVYQGRDKVWNTALRCDSIRSMGSVRLQNMIRAYAQDAYEMVNGNWAAAEFEKQMMLSVPRPVDAAITRCQP